MQATARGSVLVMLGLAWLLAVLAALLLLRLREKEEEEEKVSCVELPPPILYGGGGRGRQYISMLAGCFSRATQLKSLHYHCKCVPRGPAQRWITQGPRRRAERAPHNAGRSSLISLGSEVIF